MKQTSIEWLEMELKKLPSIDVLKTFKQAKQMHKDEIEIAYSSDRFPCSDADAEDYYQQTYGGNNE